MPFSAKTVRIFRRIALGTACFATLIALAWQIENIRGQRAWKAAFKTYADRGDPLDALPAPTTSIPSDKNFWQTPLLSRLALAGSSSPAFNEFKNANTFFDFSPSGRETWEKSQSLNLDSIAQDVVKHRQKKNLPALPSAPNAAFVLSQFQLTDPTLAELRQAALTRPDSRLVRNNIPPLGRLFEMDIPNFALQRYLARSLYVQACAALSVRDTETAYGATVAGLQLANGVGDHPYSIVEAMIAVVIQRLAIQPLWEGLQQHAWNDDQLVQFAVVLSRSHLFEGLSQSLRAERNNMMQLPLSSLREKELRLYRLMPEGWWNQNQVSLADMSQPVLRAIASNSSPTFLNDLKASREIAPVSPFSPYRFVAWALTPAYEKVTTNCARSANAARLALTACALERHRLAHGAYPESLTVLVPTYLPSLPLDVINGDPLRYRLNPDGIFTLYSVGLDGDDDNGRRITDNNTSDADGDWTW